MAFNINDGRQAFTATAAQTDFDFNFKIYADTDLNVYQNETLLTITTHYTVTIDGDNGGTMTLVSGATLNDAILLVRDLPATRSTDYQNGGDFLAGTIDDDQDYQTYLIADKELADNQHLRLSEATQGVNTELPTPVALQAIRTNADGDGFEFVQIGDDQTYLNIANVDTIAELPITPTIETYNARGYYAQNDGGGGIFNYDATVLRANANGGTIIDATGTGAGSGCWIRQYDAPVAVKWFGAKGDGATDDTATIQNAIDVCKADNIPMLFDSDTYKVTTIQFESGNKSVTFDGTIIDGIVRLWACSNVSHSGRCTVNTLEYFGGQKSSFSGYSGGFFYFQNNIVAVTGSYWNTFKDMHFSAMQMRQAAYFSGALSGINANSFKNCTFHDGNSENVYTNADLDVVSANIWIRDQVREDAEGGTYPTDYTTDGTDPLLSGTAKWSTIYTNPLVFEGGDASYPYDTGVDITYGILHEGYRAINIKNMFIEDHSLGGAFYNGWSNIQTEGMATRTSPVVDDKGLTETSTGSQGGSLWGDLNQYSIPIYDNYEFKKGFNDLFLNATYASVIAISDTSIKSKSTSNIAVRLDGVASSVPVMKYTFTVQIAGKYSFGYRGVGLEKGYYIVNGGSGQFNRGWASSNNTDEYYGVGVMTLDEFEVGDVVEVYVRGKAGIISYITGFGVFYGMASANLYQSLDREFLHESITATATDTSTWVPIVTIDGTKGMADKIKFSLEMTLTGKGEMKAVVESTLAIDSSSVMTVSELYKYARIDRLADSDVAIQVVTTAANQAQLQVQKGFFGTALENIVIVEQAEELATTTAEASNYGFTFTYL